MPSPAQSNAPLPTLVAAVDEYQKDGDVGVLLDRLKIIASQTTPDTLKAAAAPYRDLAEVVIPLYESVVARSPRDAQAMVVLANAYWLTGRGAEVVGELATRALSIDQTNRGAWHLWSLCEPRLRDRVERWRRVAERFPHDQLARAALADNATSLAHDEHDPLALQLAIETYEALLGEAAHPPQRLALEETLKTLRGWRL